MKKLRNKIPLCLLVLVGQQAMGQKLDTTAHFAVVPFYMAFENKDDETKYSEVLAGQVLSAIAQSKRFDMIDRTRLADVRREIDSLRGPWRIPTGGWGEKDMNSYGRMLKADFVLAGTIETIHPFMDYKGAYQATIAFTIQVDEVWTGRIRTTQKFNLESGAMAWNGLLKSRPYSDGKDAINGAMMKLEEEVKKFVDKYFPISGTYVRSEVLSKKGKMEQALMKGGLNLGFRIGQDLDVLLTDQSGDAGLPPKILGEAEIIDIQLEYSTIKIKSQRVNLEAIENKKANLYFQSRSH